VAYALLQLAARRWPSRTLQRAYQPLFTELKERGHRALAVSGENVILLFCKGAKGSRNGLLPFAEAFDSLVVLVDQVMRIQARLAALPTTDLKSCVVELERLRRHIQEDLWPQGAPKKDEQSLSPMQLANEELALRLEHAEWHASLQEGVLVLEHSLVQALDGVSEALRRSLGQRAPVVLLRRKEFEDWWSSTRLNISKNLRDLIARFPNV
jgi:hypothetical protein